MAKNSFNLEHQLAAPVCFFPHFSSTSLYIYPELERRHKELALIKARYPHKVPVIIEKAERTDVPDLPKTKYLVTAHITVGRLVRAIRKSIRLSAEKSLFVFANNKLLPTAASMSTIYEENKDVDGFLYLTYSGENTFRSPLLQA